MEPKILALGNLFVQLILIGIVCYAGYMAKSRKALKKHCNLMRIAVVLLIATTAIVMLPSLLGYSRPGIPISWLYIELWIHHGTGILVLAIFIYANLANSGLIRTRSRLRIPMRVATVAWFASFIMGVHIYLVIGI